VIRRELARFSRRSVDMVRVKVSKVRLEGLQYFEQGKVDARPEPTDRRLRVARTLWLAALRKKNTGNVQLGAAFSRGSDCWVR